MKIGVAARPKLGETVSGDGYFVKEYEHGILVCLMDGAGHGKQACVAAETGCRFLDENNRLDLEEIIRRLHEELRGTRGVVIGVAMIRRSERILTYAGIGNINAILVNQEGSGGVPTKVRRLTSMGGVLGYNLRKVIEFQYPYSSGDLLAMTSDGVSSKVDICDYLHLGDDIQMIAERVLQDHGKDADDATVLVFRE